MVNAAEDSELESLDRGSVEGSDPAEPRFLVIGRIVRPHGIRGEVRVEVHTDRPERFQWLEQVYLGETHPRPVAVESARRHKNQVLLKLAGYDDRNAAESLRSEWLQVPEAEALPLEEGEYYLYQLVGLAVYTDEGAFLGELQEVLETKANNIFVIHGDQGEILLPDTEEVIQEIDFENGRMTIHVIPGLLG